MTNQMAYIIKDPRNDIVWIGLHAKWQSTEEIKAGYRQIPVHISEIKFNCPKCGVVICKCGKCHTPGCVNENKIPLMEITE